MQTMLASYWDGGYVLLNVENPAAPQYIGDSTFKTIDPLTGMTPAEGNAHQAEFSFDNKFILAADEVLQPVPRGHGDRSRAARRSSAASAGPSHRGPDLLADRPSSSARRCSSATAATRPPSRGTPNPPKIAVIERGDCGFQVKVENAEARGYDRRRGVQQQLGAPPAARRSSACCSRLHGRHGLGVRVPPGRHAPDRRLRPGHLHLQRAARRRPHRRPAPPAGRASTVNIDAIFHGWGYAHLFRTRLRQADRGRQAVRDPRGPRRGLRARLRRPVDPRVGDRSRTRTSRTPSYYAGGVRVVSFGDDGIKEAAASSTTAATTSGASSSSRPTSAASG